VQVKIAKLDEKFLEEFNAKVTEVVVASISIGVGINHLRGFK